jgi:ABC-2 type transport system permease protein
MSTSGFSSLLRWELRQVGRNRLMWLVSGLLGLAMLWGALSGAALHREQDAAIERARQADAAWLTQVRERAQRYAAPADSELPYWQDPTDAAGFSRYFLRVQAYKPHLPASPLAVGVSDLMPARLPIKLETPFAVEPVFVLAYLLPIAAILLIGLLASFERDNGMLRLIAAQRVGPRVWLGARVAAIAAWLMPLVLLAMTASLAVAGVDLIAAWPELLAAAALVLVYLCFWLALGFVVASAWPSAAGAISLMVAAWAALAIGLPLAGNALANAWAPAPSAVASVDAQRRAADAIAEHRDGIVAAAFRRQPDLAAAIAKVGTIDYATRMTFLAPELERRLAPLHAARSQSRATREAASDLIGYLSPTLGMHAALSALAGTDAARHGRFEAQARRYQLRLREWFYPRIREQIAAPTPRRIAGSYGRMNYTDYDGIPPWLGAELPASSRMAAVAPLIAWLALLAAALTAWALSRLRHWPMES